jgi:hypothetical protein
MHSITGLSARPGDLLQHEDIGNSVTPVMSSGDPDAAKRGPRNRPSTSAKRCNALCRKRQCRSVKMSAVEAPSSLQIQDIENAGQGYPS